MLRKISGEVEDGAVDWHLTVRGSIVPGNLLERPGAFAVEGKALAGVADETKIGYPKRCGGTLKE